VKKCIIPLIVFGFLTHCAIAENIILQAKALKEINEISLSHGYFNEEVEITNSPLPLDKIFLHTRFHQRVGYTITENVPLAVPVGRHTLRKILQIITEQQPVLIIYGLGGYFFLPVSISDKKQNNMQDGISM